MQATKWQWIEIIYSAIEISRVHLISRTKIDNNCSTVCFQVVGEKMDEMKHKERESEWNRTRKAERKKNIFLSPHGICWFIFHLTVGIAVIHICSLHSHINYETFKIQFYFAGFRKQFLKISFYFLSLVFFFLSSHCNVLNMFNGFFPVLEYEWNFLSGSWFSHFILSYFFLSSRLFPLGRITKLWQNTPGNKSSCCRRFIQQRNLSFLLLKCTRILFFF